MKKNKPLRQMVMIVMLAALTIIVGLIEIPWFAIPPFGPFLKLDFSDVIILISIILVGFKGTIPIIILKTVIRRLIFGMAPHELLGEFNAMVASLTIVFAVWLAKLLLAKVSKNGLTENSKLKTKEWIYTIFLVMTLQTIVMFTINFFFTTPTFASLFFSDALFFDPFTMMEQSDIFPSWQAYINFSLIAYIPFNLIKGLLVSIIYLIIKPRITEFAHQYQD